MLMQERPLFSCRPPGVKKGFIKGEALSWEKNIRNFQNRLIERGYPAVIVRKYLSEEKLADSKTAP